MKTTPPAVAIEPCSDPLFSVIRSILFRLEPERAHAIALQAMASAPVKWWVAKHYATRAEPCQCMGIHFANRVGLAAGLDKNGDYIDALAAIGFGSIEIGTITPKPQQGNPQPRLFRLPAHAALINRMGFNNAGIEHLIRQVERRQSTATLGINIGKNAATALDQAQSDYLHCLQRVYPLADYVTINVSSPNTEGLRELQHGDRLRSLLESLKQSQSTLCSEHKRYVPLVIKVAPDMHDTQIDAFCTACLEYAIDGVIVGNTTRERRLVADSPLAKQEGGLSGAPLRDLADQQLTKFAARLTDKVSLVGVGGISSGADAAHKLNLGAHLVQLYSGLIFNGPALVRDCIRSTT